MQHKLKIGIITKTREELNLIFDVISEQETVLERLPEKLVTWSKEYDVITEYENLIPGVNYGSYQVDQIFYSSNIKRDVITFDIVGKTIVNSPFPMNEVIQEINMELI